MVWIVNIHYADGYVSSIEQSANTPLVALSAICDGYTHQMRVAEHGGIMAVSITAGVPVRLECEVSESEKNT